MAKKRIEVYSEKDGAKKRAIKMKKKGYTVEGPFGLEAVIWDAHDIINGKTNIAADEDGEVWLIIGTK